MNIDTRDPGSCTRLPVSGEGAVGPFRERLARVRERIAAACGRCGRQVSGVNLLPVTKKVPPGVISEAADAGLTVFGENRVQEAGQKIPACPGHLEWHMIGHLQRNKARDAVNLFTMIHSVDSVRLIEALDGACEAAGRNLRVCLEINLAGEKTKSGPGEGEVPGLVEACMRSRRLELAGLMTMPPFSSDPGDARPFFARLRELQARLNDRYGAGLSELSMGMSNDFEVAIEEGATWIRVGTALFGRRPLL